MIREDYENSDEEDHGEEKGWGWRGKAFIASLIAGTGALSCWFLSNGSPEVNNIPNEAKLYGLNYVLQEQQFEQVDENHAIYLFPEVDHIQIEDANPAELVQLLHDYHYPYSDEKLNTSTMKTNVANYQSIVNLLECNLEVYQFLYLPSDRTAIDQNQGGITNAHDTFQLRRFYSVEAELTYDPEKRPNVIRLVLAKTFDHDLKFFPLVSKHFHLTPYAKLLRTFSFLAPIEENFRNLLLSLSMPGAMIDIVLSSKLVRALQYFNTDEILRSVSYIIQNMDPPGMTVYTNKLSEDASLGSMDDIYDLRNRYRDRWIILGTKIFSGLQDFLFLFKRYVIDIHISEYEWELLGKTLQTIISDIGGFFPKMVQVIAQNDMVITNATIRKFLLKFLDQNSPTIADDVLVEKFRSNFRDSFEVNGQEYTASDCRLCDDEVCVSKAGSIGQVKEFICTKNTNFDLRLIVKTLHENVKEMYDFDYYISSALLTMVNENEFFEVLQKKLKSKALNEFQVLKILLPSIKFAFDDVQLEFQLDKEAENTRLGVIMMQNANTFFQETDQENFMVTASVPLFSLSNPTGTMLLQSKIDQAESLGSFLKNAENSETHKKNIITIISNLLSYFGYMIFEAKWFHGDLHAGNILIKYSEGNAQPYELILIDWGTIVSLNLEDEQEQHFQVLMNLLNLPVVLIDRANDDATTITEFINNQFPLHPDIQKATLLGFLTGTFIRYVHKLGFLNKSLDYEITPKTTNPASQVSSFFHGLISLSLSPDISQVIDVQRVKTILNKKLVNISTLNPPTLFIALQKNYLHLLGIINDTGVEVKSNIRVYSAWRYFLTKESERTIDALCDILSKGSDDQNGISCHAVINSHLWNEKHFTYQNMENEQQETNGIIHDIMEHLFNFISSSTVLMTEDVPSTTISIVKEL